MASRSEHKLEPFYGLDDHKSEPIPGFDQAETALLRSAGMGLQHIARLRPFRQRQAGKAQIFLIREGWAARIADPDDSQAHYLDLLCPGELCGLAAAMLGEPGYRIEALTSVTVECFDAEAVIALAATHPSFAAAMLRHSFRQTASARAGQQRMGKRRADQRLAILLMDIATRLRTFADDDATTTVPLALPLSQQDLGAATGLTPIHVNRVLRDWQAEDMVAVGRRRLEILDWSRLQDIARSEPLPRTSLLFR